MYRIGIVFNSSRLDTVGGEKPTEPAMRAFLEGLSEWGYAEGRNIVIERRSAEGKLDRLEAIIRELALLPVDLIVVSGNAATIAAKRATATVPIVSAGMATPVELGIVASLARPGGNITGNVPSFGAELGIKRIELLRQLVPKAKRVTYFATSVGGQVEGEVIAAAATMGLTLVLVDAQLPRIEAGLAQVERESADALLVASTTPLYPHRDRIVEFAARLRLPDIYGIREAVEAGGLASYGGDTNEYWRRGARYVHRILSGAKPGELPIEKMDRYSLVLNQSRARALNIAIPQSLLQRADEVIV
jgi:putative ABC transport system substrate-binding protein